MGPETPQPEQIYAPRNQLSALADLGSFVNFDWSNVQAAEIAVPPGTMLSSPVDHALLSPSSINYNTTAVATNSYNNEMLDLNLAVGLGAELYTGDHLFDFEFVTRKESVSALNNMNWMNAHGDQLQALGSLSNGGSRRGSAADWRRGSLFWLRKSQSGASGSGLGMGTSGEPLSPSTPTAGMAGLGLTSPVHSNPPPASDAMFTDHHHHHHQVAGTNMGEWQHPGEGFRRRSSMAGDLFLGLAGGSEYSASRPLHNFSLVV